MSPLIPTSQREALHYEMRRYQSSTGWIIPPDERDELADLLGDELRAGGFDVGSYVEDGNADAAWVIAALRARVDAVLALCDDEEEGHYPGRVLPLGCVSIRDVRAALAPTEESNDAR